MSGWPGVNFLVEAIARHNGLLSTASRERTRAGVSQGTEGCGGHGEGV